MHIRQNGQLKNARPRAATTNAVALTIIEVAVPTARFGDVAQLGELHRYVGHEVEITLRASPLPPDAQEPKPMDLALEDIEQNGHRTREHTRPGPTEHCSACERVIGDDPAARFYTPLAGQPHRPLCGDCALKIDDAELAAAAEAEDSAASETASSVVAESEGPIGDGPMPERPVDQEPVQTPIRRGRVRAEPVG
jgi:hypothetical protein